MSAEGVPGQLRSQCQDEHEDIPPESLRSQDKNAAIPPLHGALLKNEQDVHLFERLVFMNRANR